MNLIISTDANVKWKWTRGNLYNLVANTQTVYRISKSQMLMSPLIHNLVHKMLQIVLGKMYLNDEV